MDKDIIKLHKIFLNPDSISQEVSQLFNNKPIEIEYQCTWKYCETYYEPINFVLNKVKNINPIENKKSEWSCEELNQSIRNYLQSGFKIHAESDIQNAPFVENPITSSQT